MLAYSVFNVCCIWQEKYHRVLEEFKVMEKLAELDMLEDKHKSSNPAW